jgi:hypothetical protein
MKSASFAAAVTALLVVAGIAQGGTIGSCALQPGNANQQICTFIEGPDGTGEPPIVVTSLFAPDLPIGNIYLHEPGAAANVASDILEFTNSGAAPTAFANTFTLISDPDNETGLTIPTNTPTSAIFEEAAEGQFTTFTVNTASGANGGVIFTDTFRINSDPAPEPSTMLLLSASVLLLGRLKRWRKQA